MNITFALFSYFKKNYLKNYNEILNCSMNINDIINICSLFPHTLTFHHFNANFLINL